MLCLFSLEYFQNLGCRLALGLAQKPVVFPIISGIVCACSFISPPVLLMIRIG